ncbi:MAG: hypothetical protein IIC64_11185 [SAR324 cluster bacterium]|nr:hypothetical protein [SAR324 cluster bacterium]
MDIDFKTKISELTPQQRAWFATAMVAMVLADGNIDQAEVGFIVKITTIIKDDATVERLKKFIQFQTSHGCYTQPMISILCFPVVRLHLGW